MIQATLFSIENGAAMLTTRLGNDLLSNVIHKIAFAALSLIAYVFEWIDYAITKNTHLLSKTLFIGLFSNNLQEIRMKLLLASGQDMSEVFSETQFRKIWQKHIPQTIQDFEGYCTPLLKGDETIELNEQTIKDIKRSNISFKDAKGVLIERFDQASAPDVETTVTMLTEKMAQFFQKQASDPKMKTLASLALNQINQSIAAPPIMAMFLPSPYTNCIPETIDYQFYLHIQSEQTLFFEMVLAIGFYTFIDELKPDLGKKHIPVKIETNLGFKISCDETHGKISDVSYTTTKSSYLHQG